MSSSRGLVCMLDTDARSVRSASRLLESAGFTVETPTKARELFDERLVAEPACLILDLKSGPANGFSVMDQLEEHVHNFSIVFLSADAEARSVVQAMRRGAFDFIEKPFDPEVLIETVGEAIAAARARTHALSDLAQFQIRAARLTPRERQVVELVTQGRLNKEIASELDLAEVTVKIHRARAMRRLGVHNTAELSRVATLLERSRNGHPHVHRPSRG